MGYDSSGISLAGVVVIGVGIQHAALTEINVSVRKVSTMGVVVMSMDVVMFASGKDGWIWNT